MDPLLLGLIGLVVVAVAGIGVVLFCFDRKRRRDIISAFSKKKKTSTKPSAAEAAT